MSKDYKKLYKDVLERANKELQCCGSTNCDAYRQIVRLFPELAENDDEKIRKAIIEFFQIQEDNTTYSFIPKKDILAWLEKQGEQKPTWSDGDEAVNEYINLGLPSGTLWKSANEEGYYTFGEAKDKFGNQVPSKEQWEELKEKCKWVWKDIGYEVTGPNGNTVYLPANGYRYGNGTGLLNVGTYGYYWSSTYHNEAGAYYMDFADTVGSVNNSPRFCGLSVRLAKKTERRMI